MQSRCDQFHLSVTCAFYYHSLQHLSGSWERERREYSQSIMTGEAWTAVSLDSIPDYINNNFLE